MFFFHLISLFGLRTVTK